MLDCEVKLKNELESKLKNKLDGSLDAVGGYIIQPLGDQELPDEISDSVFASEYINQPIRDDGPPDDINDSIVASLFASETDLNVEQRLPDPHNPIRRIEAAPKPTYADLSLDDRIKYHTAMAMVTLPESFFKFCNKSPDAFSNIGTWIVEVDYAAWSGNQHVRMLMSLKPNSTIPGTDGHTIGPESIDTNGCGTLFSMMLSIIDSRASYVGFDNVRIDLKNAVKRIAAYFAAEDAVNRMSKLIGAIKANASFKGDLREVLLMDLNGMRAGAEKRAFTQQQAAGSLSDKKLALYARTAGGTRDAVVQPIQGTTNLALFSTKTAVADAVSATKSFFKPIIAAIGKVASVLGMIAGLLQFIQGVFDTHAANNRSKRISVTKKRFRTAAENMRITRGGAPNFIDELGERIYAHSEAERETRRQTNRWDRAGGGVRTAYGILLVSCALLTLALPFVAPIMVVANLLFTFAYIGWTAVRVAVLRHRNKRLDKHKVEIQRVFDRIMSVEKPKAEESGTDMKDFWRNKSYLKNRLFALEAAKHYLTAEADYDASGVDGNGLTKADRDALKLLLTEMGVPAESFERPGTLASTLAFHLIEEGSFKPADETPVQQAIQLLGKGDIESRTQGMNFLDSRIDTVVKRNVTAKDEITAADQEAGIREKCTAAIKNAFHADTRDKSEDAMRELRNLFVVPEPQPVLSGDDSAIAKSPSRLDAGSKVESKARLSQDDEILVRPAALDSYLGKLNDEADADATTALFKKLRGYSVKRVMHSLKCFSGSMFWTGKQRTRFDRVSSKVARIALDECLLVGKNNDLRGAKNAEMREKIVEFCAYAAHQDGMVGYGVFNHKVHPDFARLTSAIEGLIEGKADSRWLLNAISAWPADKNGAEDGQKFWNSMKIALLR